jgi:type III secretion system FlhB-like substrate exporter
MIQKGNENMNQMTPKFQKAYNNQNQKAEIATYNQVTNSAIVDSLIKKAIDKNIPIYENEQLLEMIAKLDLLKPLPEKYYSAISEVVSYIYKADNLS